MKNSNGKNGHKKIAEVPSKWRAHLSSYRNHLWLVFENAAELDKAIELLWSDELYDLPHSTPDGKSIITGHEKTERGVGTRFLFRLPALPAQPDAPTREATAAERITA